MKHPGSGTHQQGFTIIEILVVIVILAILATTVTLSLVGQADEARISKARADIQTFEKALEIYKLHSGFYPSSQQSLNALINRPGTNPVPRQWQQGGYVKRLEKDPWGNDYQYLNPGVHSAIDVFSYGADSQPGGEGLNADIGNWGS